MPNPLKTYPSPFAGKILLACRKCQKKLKDEKDLQSVANLKKTIKHHNHEHPDQPLAFINTKCMDLCPKRGVTICDPSQPTELRILWSEKDLERIAAYAHSRSFEACES